jgi:hypothetical protein
LTLQIVHHTLDRKSSPFPSSFSEQDGRPTVDPSQSFALGLIGSFALRFFVTFKSEFFNVQHVVIYDRLADLPLLMALFAFGRGKDVRW